LISNGNVYEGGWKEDKKHGEGVEISPDGIEKVVQYENGKEKQ